MVVGGHAGDVGVAWRVELDGGGIREGGGKGDAVEERAAIGAQFRDERTSAGGPDGEQDIDVARRIYRQILGDDATLIAHSGAECPVAGGVDLHDVQGDAIEGTKDATGARAAAGDIYIPLGIDHRSTLHYDAVRGNVAGRGLGVQGRRGADQQPHW